MFFAAINNVSVVPIVKLNEVEMYIWRCDNAPLRAHGSITDALEHLIPPAGNGTYREQITRGENTLHIREETLQSSSAFHKLQILLETVC